MKPTRPIRIEGDVAYVPLTKGLFPARAGMNRPARL